MKDEKEWAEWGKRLREVFDMGGSGKNVFNTGRQTPLGEMMKNITYTDTEDARRTRFEWSHDTRLWMWDHEDDVAIAASLGIEYDGEGPLVDFHWKDGQLVAR